MANHRHNLKVDSNTYLWRRLRAELAADVTPEWVELLSAADFNLIESWLDAGGEIPEVLKPYVQVKS